MIRVFKFIFACVNLILIGEIFHIAASDAQLLEMPFKKIGDFKSIQYDYTLKARYFMGDDPTPFEGTTDVSFKYSNGRIYKQAILRDSDKIKDTKLIKDYEFSWDLNELRTYENGNVFISKKPYYTSLLLCYEPFFMMQSYLFSHNELREANLFSLLHDLGSRMPEIKSRVTSLKESENFVDLGFSDPAWDKGVEISFSKKYFYPVKVVRRTSSGLESIVEASDFFEFYADGVKCWHPSLIRVLRKRKGGSQDNLEYKVDRETFKVNQKIPDNAFAIKLMDRATYIMNLDTQVEYRNNQGKE